MSEGYVLCLYTIHVTFCDFLRCQTKTLSETNVSDIANNQQFGLINEPVYVFSDRPMTETIKLGPIARMTIRDQELGLITLQIVSVSAVSMTSCFLL